MNSSLTMGRTSPVLPTSLLPPIADGPRPRVGSSSGVSPETLSALKGKLTDPAFAARLKAYPALTLEEVGIEVSSETASAIQKQMRVDNGYEDKNATQIIMVSVSAII